MMAVNVVDADGTVNVTAGSDVEATVVVVYTKLGKIAACCEHLENTADVQKHCAVRS